nr:MAG TPA: hypothetical protein [Caudoviricetes sp.]
MGRYPNVLLGSCIGLPGLPLIGRVLNVPSPDLNGTARPPEGDINGFAFRG